MVRDQFEWDLSSRANSPEAFAERLCADLGLRTEHVPLVAYAIREQLIEMAQFQDVRQRCRVLSPREAVRQGAVDAWAPSVDCLTTEEQERLERKEKREARLMRRNKGKAEVYGKPIRRRRSSGDASRRR